MQEKALFQIRGSLEENHRGSRRFGLWGFFLFCFIFSIHIFFSKCVSYFRLREGQIHLHAGESDTFICMLV